MTPTNREDRTNPGKKRKEGRGSRIQSQEGKTRNSRPKPDEQPEQNTKIQREREGTRPNGRPPHQGKTIEGNASQTEGEGP